AHRRPSLSGNLGAIWLGWSEKHFPPALVLLGTGERFGVLVERIGSVDVDSELAAADEAGDFLVSAADLFAGCLAKPVEGPEAVVADLAVDQVLSHRERGWLSAERAEADDLAAEPELVSEFGHRWAADRIQHERQLPPFQCSFQLPWKVLVDDDGAVAVCGNDLRGGRLAAYEIERPDTGEPGEGDHALPDCGVRACLSDPVS